MGFGETIIDEIKNRCSIVDVIGRQVPLKKAGLNHKGLCPFHSEKTPSFVVSEDKQIFTCFGCGATGDVIEFVKRYHSLDFQEAVEKLASEYGVDLSGSGFAAEGNKAKLYEINREAAAFFYKRFTETPNEGYRYMAKRGIEPAILRKFGIGFADAEWQSLYDHFLRKEEDPALLLSLGLVSVSKGRYYDKYRSRVMFPIINTRGKVIGFGGRAIGDEVPKYLNSPESPVFLKKNNLYGLNLTRQDINRENCAILVEGYMDVISLYQHGVRNVTASLGTALTENQAAMLKRYTDQILIAYDKDEAGQAAALRASDILYKAGCKVRVLEVEGEKDPDEFIKKNGKEAFRVLMQKARPFVDYKLYLLRKRIPIDTVEGRVEFLKEAAGVLRGIGPIEADAYIKKIAGETKISEGAIRQEIYGKELREVLAADGKRRPLPEKSKEEDGNRLLEKNLIRLMLLKSSYVPKIEPYADALRSPVHYRIYEVIRSIYRDDEEIDLKQLADSLEEEENRVLSDILENIHLADRDGRVFAECLASISAETRARREAEIIRLLAVLEDGRDETAILALTRELMEIQSEKNRGEMQI